ncbi:MAG: YhjD/YihY/BrkB family envelope integrity protein, partial [Pseudomonadota bacterium]
PVDIPAEADIARYLVGAGLLYGTIWLMHRVLPDRSMKGMVLWPGVLVSMVIWVLAATALSIYLAYSPTYAVTYGALAGVIVTLLFFYLTGTAIILGAQVNAVVNFGVPSDGATQEDTS